MKQNVEILGMNEMKAILRELPSKVSANVIITALRKSAVPIQKEAVSLAPSRKGTTKKAIVIKGSREADPAVYVAPTRGRHSKYDAWYSKFQEFGTQGFGRRRRVGAGLSVNLKTGKYYYRKKTVGYSKHGVGLPALHFMRNAFDAKREQALGLINENLSNTIVRFLRFKAPKYVA